MLVELVPRPIRRMARRYIEHHRFISVSDGSANLHTVMSRRPDVSVDTVINVGASNGRWSGHMMRHFPSAKYLLIEAQKAAHGAALKQFEAAHRTVNYVLCAAGDRNGEIQFEASGPPGGAASTKSFTKNDIVVPMATVDPLVRQLNFRGPFLFKLGTHAFEVPILEGARETLSQASMLIIKAYNFALCPGCLRFYELCFYLEARGLRRVDVFDVSVWPLDKAFWQMDMVFFPSTHPVFQSNEYRAETGSRVRA